MDFPEITWDQYFMSLAYLTAMKSKDLRTKVGAVIVGPDNEIRSTGFNSPCRGVDDTNPLIQQKPFKFMVMEHAERNAVYHLSRVGVSGKDCTMYVPWCPCVDCARAIIQCGIKQVVIHKEHPKNHDFSDPQWSEGMSFSKSMFSECDVLMREWSGSIVIPKIICGGQEHSIDI